MQAAVNEVKFRVRISVAEVKQWIRGADISESQTMYF